MTISAIETRYAGCRFRSRLEARWAVFFTALDLDWHYEPQGYHTNGGLYLPDFLLQQHGLPKLWLEVRPQTGRDLGPFFAFIGRPEDSHHRRGFILGDLPNPDAITTPDQMPQVTNSPFGIHPGEAIGPRDDQPYLWCTCRWGLHYDLQYEGRGHRIPCPCNSVPGPAGQLLDDRGHSANHPPILGAYRAARSARFEHGERGGL